MKLVAENITITAPAIQKALLGRDPAPLAAVAIQARRVGVEALDVNLGPGGKGAQKTLDFVLDVLREAWGGEIWLDGSNPALMAHGLGRWRGRAVLNGYSGDPAREGVLRLAAEHGTGLVVFLMDERGRIPRTTEERLVLAAELAGRASMRGVPLERLIFDPVLAPLGWLDGSTLNAHLAGVVRELPRLFGGEVQSVVGLSNLLTSSAGRLGVGWLKAACLAFLAGAGMSHVMCDIFDEEVCRFARAARVFEGSLVFAPGELVREGLP